MILTITLNPSVDRRYDVKGFKEGKVFRADHMQYTPGGKGINVSKVLKILDEDVVASGFLGGRAGDYIKENLNDLKIDNNFVQIDGETRSCIAIISEEGQTEVLENGPEISKEALEDFLKLYKKNIGKYDYIAASGSLPKGLPKDTYGRLIEIARDKNKKFILDTSGGSLKKGIEAKPYLIKPNLEELQSLTNRDFEDESDILAAGKSLLEKGIEIVVVSLGSKGSLVFNEDSYFQVEVPEVEVLNPVGSGDSMIAGFVTALSRDYSFEKVLKFAASCGTLNAMEKETGCVDPEKIDEMMERIKIKKIRL